MKYVVRSMTTTDFVIGSSKPVTPYHVYLMPQEKRGRAYWNSIYHAQEFDTPQAAEAEGVRALGSKPDRFQIAPADDRECPTYWEVQEMNLKHRDPAAWQRWYGKEVA